MSSAIDSRVTSSLQSSRRVVLRIGGKTTGPFTPLVRPSDVGRLIKPFVVVDHLVIETAGSHPFGLHPHSGIATFMTLLEGSVNIQDSNGHPMTLNAGDAEWMQAGLGVWHGGPFRTLERINLFQLWLSLPPTLELSRAYETLVPAAAIPTTGPARVLLGHLNGAKSSVGEALDLTYLDVRLKAGERWHYAPPPGHDVLWIAVFSGAVEVGERVSSGEMVVFDLSEEGVEFIATEQCGFLLGSAAQSPYDLTEGYYSVHTNPEALRRGEEEILRLGVQLCESGRLSPEQAARVEKQMADAAAQSAAEPIGQALPSSRQTVTH
jgi:redox-sensitive bicupin YhaK (pirin superfamily)